MRESHLLHLERRIGKRGPVRSALLREAIARELGEALLEALHAAAVAGGLLVPASLAAEEDDCVEVVEERLLRDARVRELLLELGALAPICDASSVERQALFLRAPDHVVPDVLVEKAPTNARRRRALPGSVLAAAAIAIQRDAALQRVPASGAAHEPRQEACALARLGPGATELRGSPEDLVDERFVSVAVLKRHARLELAEAHDAEVGARPD